MRQCAVTRERAPQHALLRLALSPEGVPFADVLGRAPGRGIYVRPDPETLRRALSPKGLGRTFRGRAKPIPPEAVEALIADAARRLEARLLELLGIARRAGLLEVGMDPVCRAVEGADRPWLLVRTLDLGGASGRRVDDLLRRAADRGVPMREIRVGNKQDLGSRLGRSEVGVVAMRPSRHADRVAAEAKRWLALCGPSESPEISLTDVGQGEQSRAARSTAPSVPRRGE